MSLFFPLFPLLLTNPGEECVILCVFSFVLVRGQLSSRSVCVAVGGLHAAEQARAGAGNLDLDRGHLLGVWGVYREKKGEKEQGGVHLESLDILLYTSAVRGDQGAV